jgi:hypothetical protein
MCCHYFLLIWRKVVCFVLFCSYEMHWTRMLQTLFLVSLESSRQGGVHGLGSVMMFGLAVQKFLNIEWFLHCKLNLIVPENFGGIGTCLWCCWKDLDEQDLMEKNLVRFGLGMWEILIFKWFLPLEIQTKSKKPGFERKNQLRTW